jgi:hypothetical protein
MNNIMESNIEKRIAITIKDNKFDVEYGKDMTSLDVIALLEIARDRISEEATKNIKVHFM